ncbi:hypothetical protein KSS87_000311 [Heliosperma pusillum]|nr:hypothetical protein KSS87_018822 [Heliosperma pusillum]KAH9616321.1 hypothetical protein KSS87_000311 [Heliosperma pusillum]
MTSYQYPLYLKLLYQIFGSGSTHFPLRYVKSKYPYWIHRVTAQKGEGQPHR